MARPRKNLNEVSSEIIEENFLQENPGILPDASGLVTAKAVPQMRRIVFLNGRDPGCALMFHYHSKHHPLKHYTLYHGKEVDLPVEVIDHLENCAEAQYGYKQGPDGHPMMYTKGHKYIFQCRAPGKQFVA